MTVAKTIRIKFVRMHLFLVWRPMEDRIGALGHTIERCLWGDSRARHTFLIACTDEHPMLLIEIDLGDHEKGIRKSMKLHITDLDEVPQTISQIQLIGETKRADALEILLQSAEKYLKEHPHYNVLTNNCRTFVEYLIDRIPEFRDSIPRKHGSILEYYHSRAKEEHPGALITSKRLLKEIRDLHHETKKYDYASRLVLNITAATLNGE